MKEWFSPEQQTVLHLLRLSLGHGPLKSAPDLTATSLDWDQINKLIFHHRIAALLYRLSQIDSTVKLPAAFRRHLEQTQVGETALTLLHTRELTKICKHLTTQHLAFVVHKGIALAALVYPDIGSRPCGSDFDLLIKKDDEQDVIRLLATLGYHIENRDYERINRSFTGEVTLMKRTRHRDFMVDLHMEFTANAWGRVTGFDLADFWEMRPIIELDGIPVPHLPVKHYFFFLAIHCANHLFDSLLSFCDLDLFVRKYANQIDWDDIIRTAKHGLAQNIVYYACLYSRMYLNTPVPDKVLESLKQGPWHRHLIPEKHLLFRDTKPPKFVNRYMHFVMLDKPSYCAKSLIHFMYRHVHEHRAKNKKNGT